MALDDVVAPLCARSCQETHCSSGGDAAEARCDDAVAVASAAVVAAATAVGVAVAFAATPAAAVVVGTVVAGGET